MILKLKLPKFQKPRNSLPKLRFLDLGWSIVLFEFLYHVALYKQTKRDTSSLCIDEALVIIVTLSIVVSWLFHSISQKRSISSKSSDSTCIFTAYLWQIEAQKLWFSCFPFTISFLSVWWLCLQHSYFFIYTYLLHLLYNCNENPTSSQYWKFYQTWCIKS